LCSQYWVLFLMLSIRYLPNCCSGAFLPRSGAELKSAVSRVIARCMHSTKLCMAEGPEVTTLTAAMRRKFRPEAYKLTDLQIISGRYENTLPEGWQQLRENLPLSLHSVHEKGKFIYFRLERGISLWSTLGMSGSWTMRPQPRFLRMRLLLERANYLEGKELLHLNYADKVEFGTFKVCFDPAELEARLNKLGPSWLHGDVSLEVFRALLKKKRSTAEKTFAGSIFDGPNENLWHWQLHFIRSTVRRKDSSLGKSWCAQRRRYRPSVQGLELHHLDKRRVTRGIFGSKIFWCRITIRKGGRLKQIRRGQWG